MTPEQQAAYVVAQAACVTAEVAAMQARNAADIRVGAEVTYGEQAFRDLISAYGIHHNAVLSMFHGR